MCTGDSEMSQDEEAALKRSVSLLLDKQGEILCWKRNEKSPHQTQNFVPPRQYRRSQSLPGRVAVAERSQMGISKRPANPNESTLLLMTRLRHGKISYRKEDVNKTTEGWKAPKEIEDSLMKKWRSTANAELLIYQENVGAPYKVVVNEEPLIIQVVDNLKETFENVSASFSIFGKKNIPPPDNTGNDMDLD